MNIDQIETPALLLDQNIMEANIRAMQDMADRQGMALRPHYKSHKSPWIARRQIAAGAAGITCAKLGEAEDLVAAGFRDVLIANQITNPPKIDRLARLARGRRLGVCVDDGENIDRLERAAASAGSVLYCLIEYDVGMKRCGAETKEEFLSLAKKLAQCPHLVYEGIQAYAGHIAHLTDSRERLAASQEVDARVEGLIVYLKGQGLPARVVSGISTGTAGFKTGGVYTEMQAGSYIFMDGAYGALNLGFRHSLFVLAEVVSAKKDRIVVDAGLKSFGVDQGPPQLLNHLGAAAILSEEHVVFTLPGHNFRIGDKALLIPGHCCTTVNLYDRIHLFRGCERSGLIRVVSRGKSR